MTYTWHSRCHLISALFLEKALLCFDLKNSDKQSSFIANSNKAGKYHPSFINSKVGRYHLYSTNQFVIELADVTLALLVLASVIFVLLLESYVQMIELTGIILALLIKVLVDVILAYLFGNGLAWVCSS